MLHFTFNVFMVRLSYITQIRADKYCSAKYLMFLKKLNRIKPLVSCLVR